MKLKDIGWKPFLPLIICFLGGLILGVIWPYTILFLFREAQDRLIGYGLIVTFIIIPLVGIIWTIFSLVSKLTGAPFWYLGNQKEQFKKLIRFIKNPAVFFEKNKEKQKTLVDFLTFLMRIFIIISFIQFLIFDRTNLIIKILTYMLWFFLAKVFATIFLWIGSRILNFFVRIIFKKDKLNVAKRVVTYSSIVMIIPSIPYFTFFAASILGVILEVIGMNKQYKLSIKKAIFLSIFYKIVLCLVLILFSYLVGIPIKSILTLKI